MVTSSLLYSPSSLPSISSSDPFQPSKKNLNFLRPNKLIGQKIASLRVKNNTGSSSTIETEEENGYEKQVLKDGQVPTFVRLRRPKGGCLLETAVVSYKKKWPWFLFNPFLQVDLYPTIHIADKEYFLTLNEELESYDRVLYEMVASRKVLEDRRDPDAAIARESSPSRRSSIIGFIQRWSARILKLDYQLDYLDYEAENWYHADLDYETFKLLQLDKGENMFKFAKQMAERAKEKNVERNFSWLSDKQPTSATKNEDTWRSKLLWVARVVPMPLLGIFIIESVCFGGQASPEVEALSRLDISSAVKARLAEGMYSNFAVLSPDMEDKSVIIGERNRAATKTLKRAINDGHNKIAIVYGAGHMPDLARRLREEFDLIPAEMQWFTAWSIMKSDVQSSSLPFLKEMAKISGWPLNRYQTLALLILSSVLAADLLFWGYICGTAAGFISEIFQETSQAMTGARM